MLDAAMQAEILRLHFSQGLSRRKIAEQLKIHRITVAAVIHRRNVRVCGSERDARKTVLDPYHRLISKLLEEAPERSAVNILQQLRKVGYQGGISSLRCYLQAFRPKGKEAAYTSLEFLPGQAAQVDWGEFGDVFGNGTKVHVFVMVQCWSRMLYIEFTQRETLATLLRCYERALHFFGGACQEHWHDNMPTVVTERHGHLVRFNAGFLAYSGFRHFKPVACHLGAGNEKGRVEDGVKLVRYQFWPGRTFRNLDDMNQQAAAWRDDFANRREHRATRKIPELCLAQEQAALLPLVSEAYETDDVRSCRVNKFHRVTFEGTTYSVPWTLVGKTLTLRADDHHVQIFCGPKRVAKHQREYRKHQEVLNPRHAEGLKAHKPGAQKSFDLKTIAGMGPNSARYLELIAAGHRSIHREVKELLWMATVYGHEAIENTISAMLTQGIVGADHLDRLLRLNACEEKAPPPLQLRKEALQVVLPTPQLESYDALLLDAQKHKEPKR